MPRRRSTPRTCDRADPRFAEAYVSLAQAEVFVAEYEVNDDRRSDSSARPPRKGARGEASSSTPKTATPIGARTSCRVRNCPPPRRTTTRSGTQPELGTGFAGLAACCRRTPARRDEALELLDRARRIDPLEPAYDVTKAVFLSYERGDVAGASKLLEKVLERNPRYLPALVQLSEVRIFNGGRQAEGIRYCEQALAIDPLLEAARRILIQGYLAVDDLAAAKQLSRQLARRSCRPQDDDFPVRA